MGVGGVAGQGKQAQKLSPIKGLKSTPAQIVLTFN